MMVVSSGPSAGGNVWMAPLISMVAERSGRRVLRTRRIDWPVRFCTVREMASAVHVPQVVIAGDHLGGGHHGCRDVGDVAFEAGQAAGAGERGLVEREPVLGGLD